MTTSIISKYLLPIVMVFVSLFSAAQPAFQTYYDQGIRLMKDEKYSEAITEFTKSIAEKDNEYLTWYARGLAEQSLRQDISAFTDFQQCLSLKPDFKDAYLGSGIARQRLTDYDSALLDYNHALTIDDTYGKAYYNRGLLLQKLGKRDSACNDFNKAVEFQVAEAHKKAERCPDTATTKIEIHPILYLKQTSTDPEYGFTEKKPVKVGLGYSSGPANQRDYLDLLRDARGNIIQYQRTGSCCEYESPNGFLGYAMVDIYKITYHDASGDEKTANVYISFYDYEEPKILYGFGTIRKPPGK